MIEYLKEKNKMIRKSLRHYKQVWRNLLWMMVSLIIILILKNKI